MTTPEYDENCNCALCMTLRNKWRVQEEIARVHKEQKTSTGTDLLEDSFR